MSETSNDLKDRQELADWLGLDARQVKRLVDRGTISMDDFDLKYCVREYCANLRDSKALRAEKEKGQRLQNELDEERLAKVRDEVIDRTVVARGWSVFITMVTRTHRGFSRKIKRKYPKTDKRVLEMIDAELADIRQQAADFKFSEAEDG